MTTYYGIQRSDTSLAHYGVKGMKWGVRKAIERGNAKRLDRHYRKAARKLQLLTARSDRNLVKTAGKEVRRRIVPDALLGGLASAAGTYAINPHVSQAARLKYAGLVGGAMAGANVLADGIQAAHLARLGSKRGNAKQMAKRKAFEKEMRKAFKGTSYAKKINQTKADIHRSIEQAKKSNNPQIIQSVNRPNNKQLSRKDQKTVDEAMKRWADSFEKHYQTGLSRGMTHEQAERYSNNYIAKNGFGPAKKKYRR